MSAVEETEFTIYDAIEQQITLGEKSPEDIYLKLVDLHGIEWLAEQAEDHLASFVKTIARRRLSSILRQRMKSANPEKPETISELKLASLWVPDALAPGVSANKRLADCTPDDFEARAKWLRKHAKNVTMAAQWFEGHAQLMRERRVKTFGKLGDVLVPDFVWEAIDD